VVESPDLKDKIINTSLGLAAGYLTEKLFVGQSHNPIKKLMGAALLFGITKAVTNNPQTIKSLGIGFLNMIKQKPAESTNGVAKKTLV
jgi:hypothetical protein